MAQSKIQMQNELIVNMDAIIQAIAQALFFVFQKYITFFSSSRDNFCLIFTK